MIQTIKDLVSAKADTTVALAREIWGYAELSYEETKSAAALIAALKQEGFTIEEPCCILRSKNTKNFPKRKVVKVFRKKFFIRQGKSTVNTIVLTSILTQYYGNYFPKTA